MSSNPIPTVRERTDLSVRRMIGICREKTTSTQTVRSFMHDLGRKTQQGKSCDPKEFALIVNYLTKTGTYVTGRENESPDLQQIARSVLAGTVSQAIIFPGENWDPLREHAAARFAKFYATEPAALDDANQEYKRRVQQTLQDYWARINHDRFYALPEKLDTILMAENALVATRHYGCIENFQILGTVPKLYEEARKIARDERIVFSYDDLTWKYWTLLRAREDSFRKALPEYENFVAELRNYEAAIMRDKDAIVKLCGDLLYIGKSSITTTLLKLTAGVLAYYRFHGLGISHW